MTLLRSTLRAGAAVLSMIVAGAACAAPPIEHFFDNPRYWGALLSPDAKSLAVVVNTDNTREKLVVIDLVTNKLNVVAYFPRADIGQFDWVNNNRLVLSQADKRIGEGDVQYGPGVYAVDRDGKNFRTLVGVGAETSSERRGVSSILRYDHFLTGMRTAQTGDEVYVYTPLRDAGGAGETLGRQLIRLDTVTGRASGVHRPGMTQNWLLDNKGTPRLATTLEKNVEGVHFFEPSTEKWRKVVAFDGYLGGPGAMSPLGFAPDGTLYVVSDAGKDLAALHTFDVKTGKLSDAPVVALDGFDFNGSLVTTDDKLLGIHYLSDAHATIWLDEAMKKVQAAVDAQLPDTINQISVARRAALPLVLVSSYSDRQPTRFALFNTETGKLNEVGASHPEIKPAEMGKQEFMRVSARDGLKVPTWLTVPAGSKGKNLPMVVMVHGGPYVRGKAWGWSPDAQFLASRGYAVIEPEFRGSTGFGQRHYRAGWKQWGLAMQNDIADVTRWAIKEGIADPKRICIAGASYGGYATLMGLVNDPDLYKCGINWVGVSDIKLIYTGDYQNDTSDGYKQYGMPALVGDLVKDSAQLDATSPIVQAKRITQPLFMAYGGADRRVPLHHGRLFYSAVKAHNPNVEMVVYNEEGHGFDVPKNKFDFWGKVEKFLDQHIGKP
jgi:dipeptidyl aminopeptidase/acylaminoacyl peptidase